MVIKPPLKIEHWSCPKCEHVETRRSNEPSIIFGGVFRKLFEEEDFICPKCGAKMIKQPLVY